MSNLHSTEIKAFIPAKNFAVSKAFYVDLGFTKASDSNGIAYFYRDNCSFLLQDFYEPIHCENFMMHLLVEDVSAWHRYVISTGVSEKYDVKVSDIIEQPWRMLDFVVYDPSGVLWRIGQNV